MTFTPDEIKKLKAMVMYLVKKKHKISDGHCGFQLSELNPIMEELVSEEKLQLRPTINTYQYFLNTEDNDSKTVNS